MLRHFCISSAAAPRITKTRYYPHLPTSTDHHLRRKNKREAFLKVQNFKNPLWGKEGLWKLLVDRPASSCSWAVAKKRVKTAEGRAAGAWDLAETLNMADEIREFDLRKPAMADEQLKFYEVYVVCACHNVSSFNPSSSSLSTSSSSPHLALDGIERELSTELDFVFSFL